MAIGERIHFFRTLRGMTQKQLGVDKTDKEVCLRVNIFKGNEAANLNKMLASWYEKSLKLKSGEIDKNEYDSWRYNLSKREGE